MSPTVEQFERFIENDAISQDELNEIRKMQFNFADYSPEDQERIQDIIDKKKLEVSGPARQELTDLSMTITQYTQSKERGQTLDE
jgi:hypothetical protein